MAKRPVENPVEQSVEIQLNRAPEEAVVRLVSGKVAVAREGEEESEALQHERSQRQWISEGRG